MARALRSRASEDKGSNAKGMYASFDPPNDESPPRRLTRISKAKDGKSRPPHQQREDSESKVDKTSPSLENHTSPRRGPRDPSKRSDIDPSRTNDHGSGPKRRRVSTKAIEKETYCLICFHSNSSSKFPRAPITSSCKHHASVCIECMRRSIQSDVDSTKWKQIACPDCREKLSYTDVQTHADPKTFSKFETLTFRAAMSIEENFIWCPASCGSGQIHETGSDQPIVTCEHCGHLFCFRHKVSWHKNLSCEEFDDLQNDPVHFKSKSEIENEEVLRDFNLSSEEGLSESSQVGMEREGRKSKDLQEIQEEFRTIKAVRRATLKRKREDQLSLDKVETTTRPCPKCHSPIEKNGRCSHMTCAICHYEFCYDCGADHVAIASTDNTAHDDTCPFHPSNEL